MCLTAAEAAEVAERAAAARLAPAVYMRRRALARPVRRAVVRRLGAAEFRELNRIGVNPVIAQVAPIGRSFKGVTAYVMHDAPEPGQEAKPTTRERVEWTDVRNLASDRPDDAWRIMAATAKAAPGSTSGACGRPTPTTPGGRYRKCSRRGRVRRGSERSIES